ncbi:CAP domain-containing protein [Adhaeribacter pallidiroseus]|uniref:SCP domain-containing protein n=1 Tax=Adhaeribacter pallidiroseus TaxID=2072847 RepID=A0A369QGG4_9BACT|nr:CAP domain-containing protein [Adhaeribacter pallidiroseus]RDC63502.1 hypothetical protein AHMF7616_02107 [Adhaeribacter pallidiroseus]
MRIVIVLFWVFVITGWGPQNPAEKFYYAISWQQFVRLPEVSKPIPLHKPDYDLLDAAIFQVTNKIREQEKKPLFRYSPILHRTATFHAQAMIDLDFYDHYNYKQISYFTPYKRITAFGGMFHFTAENIAQYDIINTALEYCPARQKDGSFKYLDCATKNPYRVYTYITYAEEVVHGWLHSPPHRKNLLGTEYQFLGAAARISKNPYQQRKVPFARLVQNFGGYGSPPPILQPNLLTLVNIKLNTSSQTSYYDLPEFVKRNNRGKNLKNQYVILLIPE